MPIFFATIGIILTFVGYAYYFRDIFRGKTKPHAFSWFVWSILTAIACAAQLSEGGGVGASITGLTAAISFVIFLLALRVGEKSFTRSDWVALSSALVALFLWWLTNNPLLSVILITLTDAFAFFPTFRKSYHKPYEETLIEYVLASIKFIFGVLALESFSVTTWLYPASLVCMNGAFVIMLLHRRKIKNRR